jgi:hypothetical protein
MDCCDPDLRREHRKFPGACPACKAQGFQVSSRTLFHHIVPAELNRITEEQYHFCRSTRCRIVYFSGSGSTFETTDLREVVSIKACGLEDFPLCYCFGFSSSDVKKASRTKTGSVSEVVRKLIARHLCDCEIRNPSGRCCLAEVLVAESTRK